MSVVELARPLRRDHRDRAPRPRPARGAGQPAARPRRRRPARSGEHRRAVARRSGSSDTAPPRPPSACRALDAIGDDVPRLGLPRRRHHDRGRGRPARAAPLGRADRGRHPRADAGAHASPRCRTPRSPSSADACAASPRPPSAPTPCGPSRRCGPTWRSSARTASRPSFGLSTPDPDEAAVKRAIVRSARRVVVVADADKLGRELLVGFADARRHRRARDGCRARRRTGGRARRRRRGGVARMIVTLTANPSLDRTITLDDALRPGEVQSAVVGPRGCRRQGHQRRPRRRGGRRATPSPCFRSPTDDPFDAALRASRVPRAARADRRATCARTSRSPTRPASRRSSTCPAPSSSAIDAQAVDRRRRRRVRRRALARARRLAAARRAATASTSTSSARCAPRTGSAAPAHRRRHLRGGARPPSSRTAAPTSSSPTTRSSPSSSARHSTTTADLAGADAGRRAHASFRPGWARRSSPSARAAPCSSPPTARGPRLPPRIRVASTVGAGDSSLAGYLLAESPARRPRSGCAGRSATARPRHPSPAPRLPRPHDLPAGDVRSSPTLA